MATSEQIALGDLTVDVEIHSSDEIGQLLMAMRDMARQLREMVSQVTQATNQVSSAAAEIAQGSADLSQRTEEQASALEETASSMEELTSTVKQSADNAGQARHIPKEAAIFILQNTNLAAISERQRRLFERSGSLIGCWSQSC
ncbi:MAG: HAMP domain-containing protein [Nitrospira sp.]|nr:HAMP domain-containing protein [Nitrospira sp.]